MNFLDEDNLTLDEKILFSLSFYGKESTAYKIFLIVNDMNKDDIEIECFNEAFQRLLESGIFYQNGNKFGITQQFDDFVGLLKRTLTFDDFLSFNENYLSKTTYKKYLSENMYKKAVEKKNVQIRNAKNSKIKVISFVALGVLFLIAGFVFIMIAGFINSTLSYVFAVSAFSFFILSLVFLICIFSSAIQIEIEHKKKKFEEKGISKNKIVLSTDDIIKYLDKNLQKINIEGSFYCKTKRKFEYHILNRNKNHSKPFQYKLISVFENYDLERAINESYALQTTFCLHESVFRSFVHRVNIVIVFNDFVDAKDLGTLRKCYQYERVGEYPMIRTPILLPIIYDKTSKTIYFKSNKIPWGLGSSFNYALRYINRIINNVALYAAKGY